MRFPQLTSNVAHASIPIGAGADGWLSEISSRTCPFVGGRCRKVLHDRLESGACSLAAFKNTNAVICCPYRLYANNYQVLLKAAKDAFGIDVNLWLAGPKPATGRIVRAFGKEQGKEIRVPNRSKGSYSVDWVLALMDEAGGLAEFVAVEVQTIDTTGTYLDERNALMAGNPNPPRSNAGFNWENVNKRILPQVIYKGHVLRRECKCRKGLYFITPAEVATRIRGRVGDSLMSYQPQPGSVTFHPYTLGPLGLGGYRSLQFCGAFTTTVDQLAMAFSAPTNLPDKCVFEAAVMAALESSALR